MTGYTLKECADMLGATKNTIKYRVRKLPDGCTFVSEDGKTRVTTDGFRQLTESFLQRTATEPVEPISVVVDEPKTEENRIETGSEPDKEPQNQNQKPVYEPVDYELLRRTISVLESQLAIKDEQIAALNNQLTHVSGSLAAAQEALKVEQQLHAGTIHRELQSGIDQEPNKSKKTSWFSWLFG